MADRKKFLDDCTKFTKLASNAIIEKYPYQGDYRYLSDEEFIPLYIEIFGKDPDLNNESTCALLRLARLTANRKTGFNGHSMDDEAKCFAVILKPLYIKDGLIDP